MMVEEQLEALGQFFLYMPDPAPTREWLANFLNKGRSTIGSLEKIFREEYPPYSRVWEFQKKEERGALCPYLCFCIWRAVFFFPDPTHAGQINRLKLKEALKNQDNGFAYQNFEELQKLIVIEVQRHERSSGLQRTG